MAHDRRTLPRFDWTSTTGRGAAPQQPPRSVRRCDSRELFSVTDPAAMEVGRDACCDDPNRRTPLPAGLDEPEEESGASLETFGPDQFHHTEFWNVVRAARDVIAERVRGGGATAAERLTVAARDEMPDEDGPDAVRGGRPRLRSVVEALADETNRARGETMHRTAAGR